MIQVVRKVFGNVFKEKRDRYLFYDVWLLVMIQQANYLPSRYIVEIILFALLVQI